MNMLDVIYYLTKNPDVLAYWLDKRTGLELSDWAHWHFENYGQSEGRLPNESFEPEPEPEPVVLLPKPDADKLPWEPEMTSHRSLSTGDIKWEYYPEDSVVRIRLVDGATWADLSSVSLGRQGDIVFAAANIEEAASTLRDFMTDRGLKGEVHIHGNWIVIDGFAGAGETSSTPGPAYSQSFEMIFLSYATIPHRNGRNGSFKIKKYDADNIVMFYPDGIATWSDVRDVKMNRDLQIDFEGDTPEAFAEALRIGLRDAGMKGKVLVVGNWVLMTDYLV